ncbi:MAG: DinB family protein [Tepidisphaeraceae bacterium]
MDLLDRLLGHDAWTTRQFLLRSQPLADEQLDRQFAIGHGSLRATFVHMIWNTEVWTDLMSGRPRRPQPGPAMETIPKLIERHDAAAIEFAALARRVHSEGRLNEVFLDTVESPPESHSFGAGIVHVVTHSMHHRAQILNMMRHLGMTDLIEGDALSWERFHAPSAK